MLVEIVLILLTFAVGVGGVFADPSSRYRRPLIVALSFLSIVTAFKAISDDSEKNYMRSALTSALNLSPSAIATIAKEVEDAASRLGYSRDPDYYWEDDGAVFIFGHSPNNGGRAVLVLDRAELAEIYRNVLMGRGIIEIAMSKIGLQRWNGASVEFLKSKFGAQYNPETDFEDYPNKVGILGMLVFRETIGVLPTGYTYDYKRGVRIFYVLGQRSPEEIGIDRTFLLELGPGVATRLFTVLDTRFRELIEPLKNRNEPGSVPSAPPPSL